MHAALDIRGQQFRPEGTQLVAVVGQPVDHGCRIVGGDHDGVVCADTLLGDDGDAILRRRRRRFLEADKGREQEATVVNTFLPFQEEHRLHGKLQLVEQFVVTDRQGRPRRYRQDPGEVGGFAGVSDLHVGRHGVAPIDEEDPFADLVHRSEAAEKAAAGSGSRGAQQHGGKDGQAPCGS